MSDEEKEAIKFLNNFKDTIEQSLILFDEKLITKCGIDTYNVFNTILNLIDKLEKENEELKDNIEIYEETINDYESEAKRDKEKINRLLGDDNE